MKTFLLSLCFLAGSLVSFSHITKADIESMMKDLGVTMADMDVVYVANEITFYKDGTWKRTSFKYQKEKGNSFVLKENGIQIIYAPEGTKKNAYFIPYSNILELTVGLTAIDVYLKS